MWATLPKDIGDRLEKDFSDFLRFELRHKIINNKEPVYGLVANRKYDCDIHSFYEDDSHIEAYRKKAILLFSGVVIVNLLYLIPDIHPYLATTMDGVEVRLLISIFLISGGLYTIYLFKTSKVAKHHCWTECKEQGYNVKRTQMVKFIQAVKDVRDNESADWYPGVLLFATKTGYDIDAINFARKAGVLLYVRDGDAFKRVHE